MKELRVDPARPREPIAPSESEAITVELPAIRPTRVSRQNATDKFAAGLRGLKHAIRGNSSYFAHAYRGTLIAIMAVFLGVDPLGWCFLVIASAFVLLAEITHSAVDVLARKSGQPDDPAVVIAQEIGAAAVLIAAFVSGALTTTVLIVKFGELFGWWGR